MPEDVQYTRGIPIRDTFPYNSSDSQKFDYQEVLTLINTDQYLNANGTVNYLNRISTLSDVVLRQTKSSTSVKLIEMYDFAVLDIISARNSKDVFDDFKYQTENPASLTDDVKSIIPDVIDFTAVIDANLEKYDHSVTTNKKTIIKHDPDVLIPSPTPTPTQTMTQSVTPTLTCTPTESVTPTITEPSPTPTMSITPSLELLVLTETGDIISFSDTFDFFDYVNDQPNSTNLLSPFFGLKF
jgi:hypothetical protein